MTTEGLLWRRNGTGSPSGPGTSYVNSGRDGEDGTDGAEGPRGPEGPAGPQGEPGPKGDPGFDGAPGPAGADGAQGPQGEQGEQGEDGEDGAPGATGATGATGPKGDKGDTGDQGPQGIQGIQGVKGDKGDTGNTGATGATGAPGSNASVGSDTLWDTKGDLAVATGADAASKLPAGANHKALLANSGETTGLLYGYGQDLQDKYLAPAGAIETIGRRFVDTSGQIYLVSGRISLTAIALPKGFTVTNITFVSSGTGVSGATHTWFALCDSSYVQLRATADDTSATPWNLNTAKTMALTSTFTTTYEGLYYLAVNVTGTVGTTTVHAANASGSYSISPFPSVAGRTSQTTPQSDGTNLAPSPTAFGFIAYAYVT